MKNLRFLTFVLAIGTLVLSACGGGIPTPTAAPILAPSQQAAAMPVAFVGVVDSMVGDQWVISGTTVTIEASIVRDGPFQVGDRVKVEGLVNPDGSLTVSRVEAPTPQETATLLPAGVDNSNEAFGNANTNDANINDGNINDSNSNDDSGAVNTNDDNGNNNSNDSNTNDDNGSNTNDDNSNDDNGNDDDSGRGRGSDDSGDDDNGSGGHGSDD